MKQERQENRSKIHGDGNERIRVLVVDDEEIQVQSICRGLFLYGYDCKGVTDSREAHRLLIDEGGEAFDILVTDLTMPGKSGYELIEQVHGVTPRFPIVVITGLTPTPEVNHLKKIGITILQKPFCPDMLDRVLRNLLE